jgi:hypothetical protein
MVAGHLPAWAEEQQHHHHHHHIHQHNHKRSQQEQQQQQAAGAAAGQEQDAAAVSSSSSGLQSSEDSLVLPLEPAATHCHTTPKDLQFPPQFSKVSWLCTCILANPIAVG